MRITFRTVQEFHVLVESDLAGLLASPDGTEVHRDRAYRAARNAGDDLTLDAPALDDSDLRRIRRRPPGEVTPVQRLGGIARYSAVSRRGA